MLRTSTIAWLATCAIGCGAFAAPAGAASGNAAATQAYLNASLVLLQSAQAKQGAAQAGLNSVLSTAKSECPRAAVASPQDPNSEALSNELVGDLIVRATLPVAPAANRFGRAVARLRWSNASLTRAIHTYATSLTTLAAMAPPNLCADVRSWVSSGFSALPASTPQFNERYKAVNVSVGELPQALARYERPSQAGLVRRIRTLEQSQADFEARATAVWEAAMNTLILQP
jgi:hypothetical protein